MNNTKPIDVNVALHRITQDNCHIGDLLSDKDTDKEIFTIFYNKNIDKEMLQVVLYEYAKLLCTDG